MYRILGELAIGGDGRRLELPGGHRLVILAVLLINANHRVSSSELKRAAWGHDQVDTTQLHKCISDLRALLGQVGRRDDLKTHQGYGYELLVDEDDLDKLVFERSIRQATAANAARRVDDEVEVLRAALRLWRGQHVLSGVPGEAFRREALELEHRRKRAAVRLYDLEVAAGRFGQILDGLGTMAGYHPTDRRLCELLMLALYRSGHATEALEAYDRHKTALVDEAGAEPEAGLRNLMYAIASGDEPAVARYAGGSPRPLVVPHQLPADPMDFVGRDDVVGEALWLLNPAQDVPRPVYVITGQGGIGKTTLAVHVAHQVRDRYPDGQLYVELRGTTGEPLSTEEALAQILRSLGVDPLAVPETRQERTTLYRTLVADRRILLLLDDAGGEAQIRDLVPGNPVCAVLVTARQKLPDIHGAHHALTLQPLDADTATELFERVVRRSGVEMSEPAATRQVVDLCAGLPLALWIAAALRVRDAGRSTAELADRLAGQRMVGLVYSDRSVERSIGAGFDRLDDDARALFLGLGLLEIPDFGVWTAAAVLDGGTVADPADVLLRLASGNLVQPIAGTAMRYRFHDLTREYARRRAEHEYGTDGIRRHILDRVYGTLLTLVRRAHRGLSGGDFDVVHGKSPDRYAPDSVLADVDRAPLSWYENERTNIRAAVRHTADLGLVEQCWDLAVSTHEFYTVRGYLDDWHATHQVALQVCRDAGSVRGEATVVALLGQLALTTGGREGLPGPDELAHSAALFHRLGEQHGQAIALRTMANLLRERGQFDRALDALTEALALYEASDDIAGRWQTLRNIGQTNLNLGHHEDALRALEQARDAAYAADELLPPNRQAYWTRLLAQTIYWLGQTHLALNHLTDARDAFQFVFDTAGDSDDTSRARAAFGLGDTALRAGELDEAERHLTTAAELARQTEDAILGGRVHRCLADLHRRQGRLDDEIIALGLAVSNFANGGTTYLQADALNALGDAYYRRGDITPARNAWEQALELYAGMGLPIADDIRRKLGSLPDVT